MAAPEGTEVTESYLKTPPLQKDFGKVIPDRLIQLAVEDPDKAAFVFRMPNKNRSTLSRQEVVKSAQAMGRFFVGEDLNVGDKVAVLINDGMTWVEVQFGLYTAGVVAINCPTFDPKELPDIAKSLGCAGMIIEVQKDQIDIADTPTLTMEIFPATNRKGRKFNLKVACDSRPNSSEVTIPQVNPEDEAVMMFTSGSTGEPKLAIHTHASLLEGAKAYYQLADAEGLGSSMVSDRPLYWSGGFPFSYLAFGITMICVSTKFQEDEDDDFFVKVLKEEQPHSVVLMDYRLQRLLRRPHLRQSLPPIWKIMTTGQRLSAKSVESMLTIGGAVLNGYGQTDCAHMCGITVRSSEGFEDGTIGHPPGGSEIKLIDENGCIVPFGEIGEMCWRGPACTTAYLLPDGSKVPVVDEDGWQHTGDLARFQKGGILVYEGRKTDMIKRATVKIFPTFIEKKLRDNLNIADAVVVAVPDDILYQNVCACVILKQGTALSIEEIRKGASEIFKPTLSPDGLGFMPGHFLLFDDFPKTKTGKYDRRKLRSLAAEQIRKQ